MWQMFYTDDPEVMEGYLTAGWEPFAVAMTPAAGGTLARVVYFKRRVDRG